MRNPHCSHYPTPVVAFEWLCNTANCRDCIVVVSISVLYSALSKVYTFGPTFRADLTHTRRHLSEFYMVEAEVCFTEGLGDILDIIEDMYKSVTTSLLRECEEDIDLLHRAAASGNGIKVPQTVTSTWPRLWAT